MDFLLLEHQVVSIIQFLNWTYVAVIKETGSYGERLTDDFKAKLKNKSNGFSNKHYKKKKDFCFCLKQFVLLVNYLLI
jgi:hypothetical protein